MQTGRWEYAQRTNAKAVIVIVAITEHDEVVFIEQYRDPLANAALSFPRIGR